MAAGARLLLMDDGGDAAMLAVLEALALDAGRAIMAVFDSGFAVETKADSSPVTEADQAAERIILEGLRRHFPDIPCVAEEEASAGILPAELGDAFFLVDPLDGTREFVARLPDFTVNIALIRGGVPEVGVVHAPARGVLYAGRPGLAHRVSVVDGQPAEDRRVVAVRDCPERLTLVASRSHRTPETDGFITRFADAELVSIGSSLKFCMLACGEADIYPRFGRTMEWDTAAGDAVLRAAGGFVRNIDGTPFRYGKRSASGEGDFVNPSFIAASASAAGRF